MGDYNGWTNRETWLVPLWYDNDEPLYKWRVAMVKERCRVSPLGFEPVDMVAAALRVHFDDHAPDLFAMYNGFFTIAKSFINWEEIAQSWLLDECGLTSKQTFILKIPAQLTDLETFVTDYVRDLVKIGSYIKRWKKYVVTCSRDRLKLEQALRQYIEEVRRPAELRRANLYTDLVDGIIAYINYQKLIDLLLEDNTKLLTD